MPTPCHWTETIIETECVGDSLDTINHNFTNLQNAICDMFSLFPPGMIVLWTTNTAPSGWALCRGDTVLKSDYPRLYQLIGNLYGPDTGLYFTLPDLRGRTAIGVNPHLQNNLHQRLIASTGGVETVSLSASQNGRHTHTVTDLGHTHTATATPHRHQVTDPGHVHTLNDPGHAHQVYYGMDPTTMNTGTLSAGTFPAERVPTTAQINYGTNNAAPIDTNTNTSTSVFQARHSIGQYNNYPGGGNSNTVGNNTFWLSNNTGTVELSSGTQPTGMYFANVNSKTTANPLMVTIAAAPTNVTLRAAATQIAINNTTVAIHIDPADSNITINNSGSGVAHENMAPFLVLNYIIKLK